MDKLLILSNASGYGGTERNIEILIPRLKEHFDITVIVENDIHYHNLLELEGINILKAKKGKGFRATISNLLMVYSLIKKRSHRYVLANTNKGAFYLAILRYFGFVNPSMVKVYAYVHDFQWKYINFIKATNIVKSYLIPTKAILEKKNYLEDVENIIVIPNAVSAHSSLTHIGINSHIILLPTTVTRLKGIEYAILALYRLKNKKAKLWVVGRVVDEDYYKYLQKLVKDYKLQDRVVFLSYTNDINALYERCDIVLNTSISSYGGPESFGRTIVEAWSFGKPVISFNVGGPKYIVENGRDGILVEEKNVNQLADAIDLLLSDEDLYCYLARNGKYKADNFYSADKVAEMLVGVIKS